MAVFVEKSPVFVVVPQKAAGPVGLALLGTEVPVFGLGWTELCVFAGQGRVGRVAGSVLTFPVVSREACSSLRVPSLLTLGWDRLKGWGFVHGFFRLSFP